VISTELPTFEEVELSLEESMATLNHRVGELTTLLFKEVDLTVSMEASLSTKYQRLVSIAKSVSDIIAPVSACSRGCSHCCKMAVTISSHEADLITKATGIPHVKAKGLSLEVTQEQTVAKYSGVPCPFLKEDVCGIYEHRPLPCRTHFNISKYPALCDIENNPGQDVPNFDLRSVWYADAAISMEVAYFDDIREFFPDSNAINPID